MCSNKLFDRNLLQYIHSRNCNDLLVYLRIHIIKQLAFPFIASTMAHWTVLTCQITTYADIRYDFIKANISLLKSHLSHIMLDFSAENIETLISSIYNVLSLAISAWVLIRQPPFRRNCPPWFNKVVKYYKNMKTKVFIKYIKSGSAFDYFVQSDAEHRFNSHKIKNWCR